MVDQFLSAPRAIYEVVEIDGVVAGLVAVGILADKRRGIAVSLTVVGSEAEILI